MARVRLRRRSSPLSMILFGAVFIIVGLVSFFSVSQQKKRQSKCTSVTSAVVTNVREQRRSRKSGKHRRYYYVYVTKYAFEVNDASYDGSTTFSASDRLDVGNTITVKYDPADPNNNFTSNDRVGSSATVIPLLTFGGFGMLFMFAGIRQRGREQNGTDLRMTPFGAAVGFNSYDNNGYNNDYNSYNNNNGNYNNSYGGSYNNDDFNQLN